MSHPGIVLPDKPNGLTKERLLDPAGSVGTALAACALRSYIAIATNTADLFPGLRVGRIHVPRSILASCNNILAGEQHAIEMHSMTLRRKDRRDTDLLIFADGTALVAMRDNSHQAHLGTTLMWVLPIVLRLARLATIPRTAHIGAGVYALRIDTGSGDPDLKMARLGIPHLSWSLRFPDRTPPPVREHAILLKTALQNEAGDWADTIEKQPLVYVGAMDCISGRFAQDAVAPDPALNGLTFLRPSVLSQANFSAGQYRDAQRMYHLAFVHLCAMHKENMASAAIRIVAGRPYQGRGSQHINIDIRCSARKGDDGTLKKHMMRDYLALLDHPSMPSGLRHMTGHATIPRPGRPALTRTQSYHLHTGAAQRANSHHDRLAAHALFGTGTGKKEKNIR